MTYLTFFAWTYTRKSKGISYGSPVLLQVLSLGCDETSGLPRRRWVLPQACVSDALAWRFPGRTAAPTPPEDGGRHRRSLLLPCASEFSYRTQRRQKTPPHPGGLKSAWHEVIWTQKTPEPPASAFALPLSTWGTGLRSGLCWGFVAASRKPWAVVPEGSCAPPAAPSHEGFWQPHNHLSGTAQFCRAGSRTWLHVSALRAEGYC